MTLANWTGLFTLVRREVARTRRVIGQALLAPLVTASLYLFVFGYVIGGKISSIEGLPYLTFVFPGVFAMNLVIAVFSNASFSSYMMKFQKTIEDMLTMPLSYTELVLSMLLGSLFRGLAIMVALAAIAFGFGVVSLAHPFALLGYVLLVSVLFGLTGIVVGIWADNSFEKLGIATNFILTPLSFLGGAFYSIHMLPEKFQLFMHLNPLFYAIDGIRFGLTGYHEASLLLGLGVLFGLSALFLSLTVYIFRTGWKVRS